jgi:hypothetical protein
MDWKTFRFFSRNPTKAQAPSRRRSGTIFKDYEKEGARITPSLPIQVSLPESMPSSFK